MKQRPIDFALLGAGVLTVIGSISPWFTILILNVAGTDTWWGFITIGSGVLVIASAAARIWPNLIQAHLRRGLQTAAVATAVAALATVSYVGLRLTDVSRDFNDSIRDNESTTQTTIADDIFGDFSDEFQKSLDEFSNSLVEAFKPRLASGWYITLIASLGGLGLLVWRRRPLDQPTT
jgi:hypothetical protein